MADKDTKKIDRWNIGTYLHEDLAQKLVSAKISTHFLKNELSDEDLTKTCEMIIYSLDESIKEIQDLFNDILLMDVEKEGVGQAFNYLKCKAVKQHEIRCRLETDQIIDKINNRTVTKNLYRITEESIENAVSQREAKNIKIILIEHSQQLFLYIKDDGKGLDTSDERNGMDITIMNHRAEEIGGRYGIQEVKGDREYSTIATCSLPLGALDINYNT